MKTVLITGMSGTGKSTVIRELAARGFSAIETTSRRKQPGMDLA